MSSIEARAQGERHILRLRANRKGNARGNRDGRVTCGQRNGLGRGCWQIERYNCLASGANYGTRIEGDVQRWCGSSRDSGVRRSTGREFHQVSRAVPAEICADNRLTKSRKLVGMAGDNKRSISDALQNYQTRIDILVLLSGPGEHSNVGDAVGIEVPHECGIERGKGYSRKIVAWLLLKRAICGAKIDGDAGLTSQHLSEVTVWIPSLNQIWIAIEIHVCNRHGSEV